jgi:hypothetical protein
MYAEAQKSSFVRTTKSTLELHNAHYNTAQITLLKRTYLEMSCFQRQQFNIINTWIQYGVAGFLVG